MQWLRNILPVLGNYVQNLRVADILDIAIVAFLIYRVLMFVRRTNAKNVTKGIFFLLLVMWVSEFFHLNVINYLIGRTFEMGLIALIVLFQPELRSFLESFGNGEFRHLFGVNRVNTEKMDSVIAQTVMACEEMSRDKIGALIVFEREISLENFFATGTIIRAEVSSQLLRNLFYPKAPLHDGAVIIRGALVECAGCVLPLSANTHLSRDLGTRHRAGVGISEVGDSVTVIVSEETGAISLATAGVLKRNLSRDMLENLLRKELIPDTEKSSKNGTKLLRKNKTGGEGKGVGLRGGRSH